MKAIFYRLISQLLVLSIGAMPFATQAAMVGTDSVIANAQAQASRDRVLNFVARADVQKQLQTLGLNPDTAKDRVNALTDQEVQQLAGKIDSLPAGGWEFWGVIAIFLVIGAILYVNFGR